MSLVATYWCINVNCRKSDWEILTANTQSLSETTGFYLWLNCWWKQYLCGNIWPLVGSEGAACRPPGAPPSQQEYLHNERSAPSVQERQESVSWSKQYSQRYRVTNIASINGTERVYSSKSSGFGAVCSTFTFMNLADAFIQSGLQWIQAIHLYCLYVCSLQLQLSVKMKHFWKHVQCCTYK